MREMQDRGLSEEYVVQSRRELGHFRDFCLDRNVRSAKQVSVEHLREYLSRYAKWSENYQKFNYAILRGFLIFAENPTILKYRHRVRGRGRNVRWLSPEETERVLSSRMRPKEALMVYCGLMAGLRRCEVRALTVADLKRAVSIGKFWVKGKGSKAREVPAHPDVRFVMAKYLTTIDLPDSSIALSISKNHYLMVIKGVSARVGIPFTSHALRRTFATALIDRGVPLLTVSRLLGHSSTSITEMYVATGMTDLEKAIEALPSLGIVQSEVTPA